MQIQLLVLNSQYHYYYYQVGEEHEYYLPMLILIVASIVLQVNNVQIDTHLSSFWPQYCQYWHKKQLKKLGFVKNLTVSLCPGVEWSSPSVDGASQS